MPSELLYRQNEFLIAAALFALLLLVAEVGFRRGRAILTPLEEHAKNPLSTLQGALAGLLSLLLAFSFAMANTRFDERKKLLVEEANAIGTAELRARLLAEPFRTVLSDLFLQYVDTRLRTYDAEPDSPGWREAEAGTERLQQQLWRLAMQSGAKDPNVVPSGLFLTALNEVIDVRDKRDAARANHVPQPTLVLLFVVACFTMGLIGQGCGGGGYRHFSALLVVAAAISLTILVIVDLDRPVSGLIQVRQQNMLDLRDRPIGRDPVG
jgi:hypothetical protein